MHFVGNVNSSMLFCILHGNHLRVSYVHFSNPSWDELNSVYFTKFQILTTMSIFINQNAFLSLWKDMLWMVACLPCLKNLQKCIYNARSEFYLYYACILLFAMKSNDVTNYRLIHFGPLATMKFPNLVSKIKETIQVMDLAQYPFMKKNDNTPHI